MTLNPIAPILKSRRYLTGDDKGASGPILGRFPNSSSLPVRSE